MLKSAHLGQLISVPKHSDMQIFNVYRMNTSRNLFKLHAIHIYLGNFRSYRVFVCSHYPQAVIYQTLLNTIPNEQCYESPLTLHLLHTPRSNIAQELHQ